MNYWFNHVFESFSIRTVEFTKFASDFKQYIKKMAKRNGFKIFEYSIGHFYVSGFAMSLGDSRTPPHWVYFSISDVRFFPEHWHNNILIRTALGPKDYTGGRNHYTTLDDFGVNVAKLLKTEHIPF